MRRSDEEGRVMIVSEADLVSKMEILLQEKYKTNLIFREVSAGYGIADLVVALPSSQETLSDRFPIARYSILQLYLSLGRGRYTFKQIAQDWSSMNVSTLRGQLGFLAKHGYLIKTGSHYKKSFLLSVQQPIRKIIAVEVKLSDYRRGIIQAKRYQYFADQTYLAILEKATKNLDIEHVRQDGVGLMLFDELTDKVRIMPPKISLPRQGKINRMFATEILLKRMQSLITAS